MATACRYQAGPQLARAPRDQGSDRPTTKDCGCTSNVQSPTILHDHSAVEPKAGLLPKFGPRPHSDASDHEIKTGGASSLLSMTMLPWYCSRRNFAAAAKPAAPPPTITILSGSPAAGAALLRFFGAGRISPAPQHAPEPGHGFRCAGNSPMNVRRLAQSDLSPSPGPLHALFFRPPPSITASFDARRYTAATLRLSLRAITVVFVCSRASVFSMRSSSFVHGRLRVRHRRSPCTNVATSLG
jgi:hypothetical protein